MVVLGSGSGVGSADYVRWPDGASDVPPQEELQGDRSGDTGEVAAAGAVELDYLSALLLQVSPASGPLTEAEVRTVLLAAGWPEHLWEQASAVSFCESGYTDPDTSIPYWKPGAIGDRGVSLGLFQLGGFRPGWQGWFAYFGVDEAEWADPIVNARVAWLTWQYGVQRYGYGWGPWSCRWAA